jgi:hypothetical protein
MTELEITKEKSCKTCIHRYDNEESLHFHRCEMNGDCTFCRDNEPCEDWEKVNDNETKK